MKTLKFLCFGNYQGASAECYFCDKRDTCASYTLDGELMEMELDEIC
ncbi:MAG: hypothetical protein QXZ28_05350 [Candidatus Methanomethylicaceae archaeon]